MISMPEPGVSRRGPVYTKNFSAGPSWIPGTVESVTGPVSCTVLLGSGQRVRRHVDHVRHRSPPPSPTLSRPEAHMEFPQVPCPSSSPTMDITTDPSGVEQSTNVECSPPDPPAAIPPAPPVLRRSGRESRPPDRYVP